MSLDIHLVSHTHWDREWYRIAEVFRQRLVDLVDDLIDEPAPQGTSFLLDGQAIVLDDYLVVRESRRDSLKALLRGGRLEAGPWYVLPDELIPSGEALVRNLLAGRRTLASFEATAPPVLYCPDSFGHPAALPDIARGFGLDLVILWRGYGGRRWPTGDVARWSAPSGEEVLLFHLPPDGYEFGSSLPPDAAAAHERWKRIRAVLVPRSTLGITLLQNGADHHARQRELDQATKSLISAAAGTGDNVRRSSLRSFVDALAKAASKDLPQVKGELRDSYGYTWTLQGTFGTRAAQKRHSSIAERTLVRSTEPWTALAWVEDGRSTSHHVHAAWKTLLAAHPHDTLCGTSIDDVAAAMDVRVASATAQARAMAADSIARLIGYDPSAARENGKAGVDQLVVVNESARPRKGIVLLELIEKAVDEPVGPGSGKGPSLDALRKKTHRVARPGCQVLETRITRDRIESARHYPDNDIVRVTTMAARIQTTPAFSLTPFVATDSSSDGENDVLVSRRTLHNGLVSCRVSAKGVLSLDGAHAIASIIALEDRIDRGDLYTPSIRAAASRARLVDQRVVHEGPLIGELGQSWEMVPPKSARAARSTVDVSVRLTADSPRVEFHVHGTNAATNHRLRIGIATGIAKPTVFADAAFGLVERAPLHVSAADSAMETPPATAPMHRYVTLSGRKKGATVYSDGLGEYEVDARGVVWITLVRAVGELSRNDLPERPGHAGWPEDTPVAQSIGPFEARFALLLHHPLSPTVLDMIEAEADAFLTPLHALTLRSTIADAGTFSGPELRGVGLASSAVKQSEDGKWLVLRCVNRTDAEVDGSWLTPFKIREAKLARLDETPLSDARVQNANQVFFRAAPRSIVTALVAPSPDRG